jgi:hypothetical protein
MENSLLIGAQNDFRKNKSTDTSSLTFIESIQEALDRELYAIGLFFYLLKAYDVINYDVYILRYIKFIWHKRRVKLVI